MFRGFTVVLVTVLISLGTVSLYADSATAKEKYLVKASGGPGPGSPAEAISLLDGLVLPTFDMLMKWEKEGKIVGGLPVGSRSFVMIVEAESNQDLDRMLRTLPMWSVMDWKVVPLESIAGRAEIERKIVGELKASTQ
ncbi:MAG: hypothetical protein JSW58_04065 [Candidatus Latescibacterota bacterium]|nr:MAG: hypothetical protein JSW58_04065 [Candidatus Latescibacterota bacterium]